MRELHLFAGAGGGILAGQLLGHTCVGAVESDAYCRRVLQQRQTDRCLPAFPIHDDVRTFNGFDWRGVVDVVCGGFPCQPWSDAGKRRGADDERDLWPEMARVVREVRPAFVFAENVSLRAFAGPWRDLRDVGYRVPPALCLAARDVGAPHLRERWWLLAVDPEHPDADRWRQQVVGLAEHRVEQGAQRHLAGGLGAPGRRQGSVAADADGSRVHQCNDVEHIAGAEGQAPGVGDDGETRPLADAGPASAEQPRARAAVATDGGRADGGGPPCEPRLADAGSTGLPIPQLEDVRRARWRQTRRAVAERGWWAVEPRVGRVAHGVAKRVDRLRALGNGQVPAVAALAFLLLMERLNGAE